MEIEAEKTISTDNPERILSSRKKRTKKKRKLEEEPKVEEEAEKEPLSPEEEF